MLRRLCDVRFYSLAGSRSTRSFVLRVRSGGVLDRIALRVVSRIGGGGTAIVIGSFAALHIRRRKG